MHKIIRVKNPPRKQILPLPMSHEGTHSDILADILCLTTTSLVSATASGKLTHKTVTKHGEYVESSSESEPHTRDTMIDSLQ